MATSISVGVDVSGVKRGVDEIERQFDRMDGVVSASGQQAEESIAGVTAEAAKARQELESIDADRSESKDGGGLAGVAIRAAAIGLAIRGLIGIASSARAKIAELAESNEDMRELDNRINEIEGAFAALWDTVAAETLTAFADGPVSYLSSAFSGLIEDVGNANASLKELQEAEQQTARAAAIEQGVVIDNLKEQERLRLSQIHDEAEIQKQIGEQVQLAKQLRDERELTAEKQKEIQTRINELQKRGVEIERERAKAEADRAREAEKAESAAEKEAQQAEQRHQRELQQEQEKASAHAQRLAQQQQTEQAADAARRQRELQSQAGGLLADEDVRAALAGENIDQRTLARRLAQARGEEAGAAFDADERNRLDIHGGRFSDDAQIIRARQQAVREAQRRGFADVTQGRAGGEELEAARRAEVDAQIGAAEATGRFSEQSAAVAREAVNAVRAQADRMNDFEGELENYRRQLIAQRNGAESARKSRRARRNTN